MLIKCKVLNKEKWDTDTQFWNSEYNKGHIDLIHPCDRNYDVYWDSEIEIEVDDDKFFKSSSFNYYLMHDYYVNIFDTEEYRSLSDVIFWCERSKWGVVPDEFKQMDRDKKINQLLW